MSDQPATVRKINIPAAFGRINEQWSPHVAARINEQEVRLAKISGAFEWHRHDDADEAFYVVKGGFTMRLRDRDIAVEQGDLIVIPAGVEHMPEADEECWIMLIENAGVVNTGANVSERTRISLPEL